VRHPGLDLVNSLHLDGRGGVNDRLTDDAWLERFRKRWELGAINETEWQRLHALRTLLRALAESLTDGTPALGDIEQLSRWLPPLHSRLSTSDGTVHLDIEVDDELTNPTGRVAFAFARLIADQAERIRVCANPDCRWAFYDESRNRTRRWCSSQACGNVMKVRRHRARHRATYPT